MIVVEHDDVELDYCTACSGVWFDAGEVELLLEKMGLESAGLEGLHLAPEAKSSEGRRKCPICRKKMKKVAVGRQEDKLVVDACPDGDGLWFDGGEVGQLVKHLASQHPREGAQEKVIDFLGEVFKVPG
jgi:hypothetical protein